MSAHHIRWLQRLSNYRLALAQLRKFIDKGQLNELEQQGMIKAFTLFCEFERRMVELSHAV